ncbi:MAG: hypothetical protein RQ867_09580 [Mariprofundaceae bacterium]|nr:hypothetical protein [Mariprofundaceae bacterium]
MLEYVFFDQRPFDQFLHHVKALGLHSESRVSDRDEYLVELPEDMDEAVMDDVEAFYEKMMGVSEALLADTDEEYYSAAGVQVTLADGSRILASVEPGLLKKVLSVLSYDELAQFVDAIASAVENPDSRPICKRGQL